MNTFKPDTDEQITEISHYNSGYKKVITCTPNIMVDQELKTVYCTYQGQYHIKRNGINEDAIAARGDSVTHALTLCDGVGSLPESGALAAKIVSRCVSDFLWENFESLLSISTDEARAQAAIEIHKNLKICAQRYNLEKSILCTTIVAAALDIEGNMVALHLGDGAIIRACNTESGIEWRQVSSPENGLFNNETYATGEYFLNHLRFIRWNKCPSTQALLLCTDGISLPSLTDIPKELVRIKSADDYTFSKFVSMNRAKKGADDTSCGMIVISNKDF